MNEQAINDAYSLFTQNGYKKSIDDFKTLISTNPQALSDAYSLFTQNGYKKSEEDFKVLMGVGATPTELKKKEPTASPSSAGQLPSQEAEKVVDQAAKTTKSDQQVLYGPMGAYGLTPTKKRGVETWDNFSKATEASSKSFIASAAIAAGEALDISSTVPMMGVTIPGRDFGTYTREKMRQLKGEGDEMAGASLRRFAEKQKEEASKIQYDADTATGFLGALVPSTAGVAASVAASYVSPTIGAGLGYASLATLTASSIGSGIETYDEYKKEKGLDIDPAARLGMGVLFGAAELLTEKIQLDRFLPAGMSKKAMQTFLRSMPEEVLEREGLDLVRRFASESASNSKLIGDLLQNASGGAISEGFTEALTSVVQEASKYAYYEKEDQSNIFSKDFLGEVASSFLGGAVMGAGLGPLSFGSQRVSNNKRRKAAGEVVVGKDSETGEALEIVGRDGDNYIVVKASGQQATVPVSRVEGSETKLSYDAFKNILEGSSAGTAIVSEDPDAPQAGESFQLGLSKITVESVDPVDKLVTIVDQNGAKKTYTFDQYKTAKEKSYSIETLNDGVNDVDFFFKDGDYASTEAIDDQATAQDMAVLMSMRYPSIEFGIVDQRPTPTSEPDFRIVGRTKPSAQAQQQATQEPGGAQPVTPQAPQPQPVDQGVDTQVPVEEGKPEVQRPVNGEYSYLLTQRPPSIGTHPEGTIKDAEEVTVDGRKAWKVTYDKPLTQEQIDQFELTNTYSEADAGRIWSRPFGKDSSMSFKINSIDQANGQITYTQSVTGKKPVQKTVSFRGFDALLKQYPELKETVKPEAKKPASNKAKDIADSIKKAGETLKVSFPDVKYIVAENQEDAAKQIIEQLTPVVGETTAKKLAKDTDFMGITHFVNGKPVAVVINKADADSSTAAHEVWHLILRDAFGKNPKKFKEFREAIANELINAGFEDINELLDDFSSGYKGTITYEEYLVEFGGLLATAGFNKKKLTDSQKGLLNRIKDVINKFSMDLIGKKIFLEDATPENIMQFMIAVSDAIAKGEDVRPYIRAKGEGVVASGENVTVDSAKKQTFDRGVAAVKRHAEEYKALIGNKARSNEGVPTLFGEVSRMMSKEYEKVKDAPNDPIVKEAYEAMMSEVLDQYDFIVSKGLKVVKHTGKGEPYANSTDMLNDLRDNNTLKFLPNEVAFGQGDTDVTGNIGLEPSGRKLEDGYELTKSEVFRVVHDYFGHGILGNQFGPIGEENATLQHLDLFSSKAAPAVILQTRGQNSWVNFSGVNDEATKLRSDARKLIKEGKAEEANKLLKKAEEIFKFAEPKIGLFDKKFNFRRYETARRLKEQEAIDSRAEKRDNELSGLLEKYSRESRRTRGVNKRDVQETRKIGGVYVSTIAEYSFDDKINNGIQAAFSRFKGVQKVYEITDGAKYRQMMIDSLKDNPFASSVTIHSAEDFNQMRMFVTEDGSTGITITKEGFLGGAFSDPNAKRPNNLAQLMVLGIKEGATTAEAFDTVLPDYYSLFGFKAVSRTAFNDEYRPLIENGNTIADWDYDVYKDYNNGRPDVVFFIYDGGDRNTIEDRLGLFDKYNYYDKEFTKAFDKDGYMDAEAVMKQEAVKRLEYDAEMEVESVKKIDKRISEKGVSVPKKLGQELTPKNEKKLMKDIDDLLSAYPNALTDRNQWTELMSRVFSYKDPDTDEILIPSFPEGLARMASVKGVLKELEKVSLKQRELASEGLAATKEIGKMYADGKMDEVDTGLYFLWNIMSIGISPYPQESGFLRAVDAGIDVFIKQAADGTFLDGKTETIMVYSESKKTMEPKKLDTGILRYYEWVDKVLEQGKPGAGSKSNLRSFGLNFLSKASMVIEEGEFKGMTRMKALHSILSDRKTPTNELRRKWQANMSGMSFNNKIFDFILLTTGRSDLFVIDRVRTEHFWDAKNLKKKAGIDPSVSIYDGSDLKHGKSGAAGFSKMLSDVPGLVFAELANRTMQPIVKKAYEKLGVKDSPDVGRFHWETWVASSSQEVSHGSIDAIIQRKERGTIKDAGIRQGKYGSWDFNFSYKKREGMPFMFEFIDDDGNILMFDDISVVQDEINAQNTKKTHGTKETRFILKDEKGNVIKRKTGDIDLGWYDQPGVDKQKYFDFLKSVAKEVIQAPKVIEDQGVVIEIESTKKKDQTNTPEFKKWFGDSKVVDKKGEPLVVYHGTPNKFTAFFTDVIYITANKSHAKEYGKNILSLYASIKNPYITDNDEVIRDENGDPYVDEDGEEVTTGWLDANPEVVQDLMDRGFDGVYDPEMEYMAVFSPNQVKSATENIGTFDPDEVEITKKKAPTVNVLAESDGMTFEEANEQGLLELLSAIERETKQRLNKARRSAAKSAKLKERNKQQKALADFMMAKERVVKAIQAMLKSKFVVNGKPIPISGFTVGQVNKILDQVLKGKSLQGRYKIDPGGNRVPYMSTADQAITEAFKIINKALLDSQLMRARANRRVAKNNVKAGKLGVLPTGGVVDMLLQIDPSIIPLSVLPKYMDIVSQIGQRKKVLSLDEQGQLSADIEAILQEVDIENSLLEQLIQAYNNHPKVMAKKKDSAGNVVMVESFSETVKDMHKQGIISDKERDLMLKRRSEISARTAGSKKAPATKQEVKDAIKRLIKAAKASPNPGAGFTSYQNNIVATFKNLTWKEAERLVKEVRDKDGKLLGYDISDLATLSAVYDNIQNKYITNLAEVLSEKIIAGRKAAIVAPVIAKYKNNWMNWVSGIKSSLKNGRGGAANTTSIINEKIRRTGNYAIDVALNNFQNNDVYNEILRDISVAIERKEAELNKIAAEVTSILNSMDTKDQFKQNTMVRMIALHKMALADPTMPTVQEWLDSTKKGNSQYLPEVLESFQKMIDEVSVNGDFDLTKAMDYLSPKGKKLLAAIERITLDDLSPKAAFGSTVIRGTRVPVLEYYTATPRVVNGKKDVAAEEALVSNYTQPSSRASTFYEKTKQAHEISFDAVESILWSAKHTLTDFYLTREIRIAKQAVKNLLNMGFTGKTQQEAAKAIELVLNDSIEMVLNNQFVEKSLWERGFKSLATKAYQSMLAGFVRPPVEFISNVKYAIIENAPEFIAGTKIMSSNLPHGTMSDAALNLGSTHLGRMFDLTGGASRYADRRKEFHYDRMRNEIIGMRKVGKIVDGVGEKFDTLSNTAMSAPDQIVARAVFFGSLSERFKEISGNEIDLVKIANNDQAYIQANKKLLDQAVKYADMRVSEGFSSSNDFDGVLKNKVMHSQNGFVTLFQSFNAFMTKFMISEYVTSVKAVNALLGNGYLTRKEAGLMLTAQAARMLSYKLLMDFTSSLLYNTISGMIKRMFGVDPPEEEEVEPLYDEDGNEITDGEETFWNKLAKESMSVVAALAIDRNFGNIMKAANSTTLEYLNREYGEGITYKGVYNKYEDNISYPFIDTGKQVGRLSTFEQVSGKLSGVYSPYVKNLIDMGNSYDYWRAAKKPETKEKYENRFAASGVKTAMLVTGFPFYRDINKIFQDVAYEMEQQAKRTESKFEGEN